MQRNKKNIMLRSGISYILAFILTICLTLATVLVVIRYGCFNEDSLLKNMSSNSYYDDVYEDMMGDLKSMTIPTGLPDSVYENAITRTAVHNDINGKVKAQFAGEAYTSKSEEIKSALNANIAQYLKDTDYTLTDEEERSITSYVNAVLVDYENYISMPFIDILVKAKNMFDKVFLIAVIALLVMSAIAVYVELQLHKWLHRALRYLSYTALGCAVMLISVPGYFYLAQIHYRLNLKPESFYNLATTYIDNILKLFLYFGLLWIVVAILVIIATVFTKKYYKKG